jgi:hypothetical protein
MTEDAIDNRAVGSGVDDTAKWESSFSFLPADLSATCRMLIESYHAMHGLTGLPDMLWRSNARGIIENDRELALAFTRACRSRGARRANESFVTIAVVVMSLEILARDFAGWGKRFQDAKSQAEKILGDRLTKQRTELMDLYLYPSLTARRELTHTFAPSLATAG